MRQPVRARALLAVSLAAIVLAPGGARTQGTAGNDDTISTVPVPGGLAGARTALNEPATSDASTLLVNLIRRSYETPVGLRTLRRDAVVRPLTEQFERASKAGARAQATDDVPLPLTAAVWTSAILGGRATSETLLTELLRSPGASLMYCALLELDPATRDWFAANPALLTAIAERYAAAFLVAAPGVRIRDGAIQVPGGSLATAAWQALVGRPVTEPAEFVRALLAAGEGRLSYFYGALAGLQPAAQRFVLASGNGDAASQISVARRMFAVFDRVALGWDMEDRPFWRPALDPALLASDLPTDASGTPRLPGTTAFWTAVFSGEDGHRDRIGIADGPPVEFAWLCEQVFTGAQAVARTPYQQVLFAARRFNPLTRDDARGAVVATRAVAQYPALVGALEREGFETPALYAAAALRAAAIAAIDDEARASVSVAQFQGALAFTTRAFARGSIDVRRASELIAALAAVETDARGDYGGRVVQWLMDAAEGNAAPGSGSIPDEGDGDPGGTTLDDKALAMLAGARAQPRDVVEWEGTRYRVDPASAEAIRLRRLLGRTPTPYLSAAASLVSAARAVEGAALSGPELSLQADTVTEALAAVSCDRPERWPSEDLRGRCRETLSAFTRAARSGDSRTAARLASRLRLLADSLLARGLTTLAYAVALGQPDVATIAAGEAASRHEFGFGVPGFGRQGAWRRPAAGADRAHDWHVTGSMLGLDVALSPMGLVRLTNRPPVTRPTLNDEDRRVFIDTVALMEGRRLTPDDHQAIVAALRRGRERLSALRTDRDVASVATAIDLTPTQRSLLSWTIVHQPAERRLSPYELLRLGDEGRQLTDRLHAWGVSAEPRIGCPCLQMPASRQAGQFSGRWHTGVLATGVPDLNLRVAEMLAELEMPATLLPSVLAAATWDLVLNVRSRDFGDRQGLVEFVDGLTRDRFEQYLALLTTDGPLVPVAHGSSPH